jgi:hypothetical protein
LKDKSIGLIKWQKAGLENLLRNPCIKRRIRRSAIRDYQMGEHKNPSHPFNVAPTKSENRPVLRVIDFRLKHSCRQIGTEVIHDRTTVSLHTQSPASWGKNLIVFFRVSVKFIFFYLYLSIERQSNYVRD